MLKAKELTAPGISVKIKCGLFDERPLTKMDALFTLVWAKVKKRCRVSGLSYKTNYPVLALNQYENTSKSNKAALALFSNLNRGSLK